MLLAESSPEEFCALLELPFIGDFPESFEETFDGFEGFEDSEAFASRPVDDDRFTELERVPDDLLGRSEEAVAVSATIPAELHETLVVNLVPDVTRCEALAGLDLEGPFLGPDLEEGTFLAQPSVEEFCAVIEGTLGTAEEEFGAPGGHRPETRRPGTRRPGTRCPGPRTTRGARRCR